MADFGFYRVGDAVTTSMTILVAPTFTEAKRQAVEAIEVEGLLLPVERPSMAGH